ncbi:hypothetical protein ACWGKX_40575, partial [Streptomyces tricolor]
MTRTDRPAPLPRRRLIQAGLAVTGAAMTTALSGSSASAAPDARSRARPGPQAAVVPREGAPRGGLAPHLPPRRHRVP